MKKAIEKRSSEHGGAGVKLLIVALVIFLLGNAGYHWVPVAYAGESLKQDIEAAVLQGFAVATGGKISREELVKKKILAAASSNNINEDIYIEIEKPEGIIQAHVTYTQEVPLLPFGIFNYEYEFDYTASPTGLLTK